MDKAWTFDDCQLVPRYSEIESRGLCDTMSQFTRKFRIPLPLVGAPMDTVCGVLMVKALTDLGATGCFHRFIDIQGQYDALIQISNMLRTIPRSYPLVGTVGATGDYEERTHSLIEAGANVILIDVAHGDHLHVKRAIQWIRSHYDVDVIAGNIATADAAQRLEEWGADAVRVGVGGGSMCETRVRTGIGVPQLTAVADVAESGISIPIISDGGIRYPGDVAKALAAGANTVMLGSMLAGTDEAPGDMYISGQWPNETRAKVFRGSASASQKGSDARYVEGTSRLVPLKGPVKNVIDTIMDGVRSAMSYLGVDKVEQMSQVAEFVRITNAGLVEAHPHGLKR